jgi:hypothetical protein
MKAKANRHGVTWATSKNGKLDIAVGPDSRFPGKKYPGWRVWALYKGTHDLAPVARDFPGPTGEADARKYANEVWGRR